MLMSPWRHFDFQSNGVQEESGSGSAPEIRRLDRTRSVWRFAPETL